MSDFEFSFNDHIDYDSLKDKYPNENTLIKDVETFIKNNKALLNNKDYFTFINEAMTQNPYKDFLDILIYTLVSKKRINIFTKNLPNGVKSHYRDKYASTLEKIKSEEDAKIEDNKRKILNEIQSGNLSDLQLLKYISSNENSVFNAIRKNKLCYKIVKLVGSISSYMTEKKKDIVILEMMPSSRYALPYFLIVAKTETILNNFIKKHKLEQYIYDSLTDTDSTYESSISRGTTGTSVSDAFKAAYDSRKQDIDYKYSNDLDFITENMNSIYNELDKIDDKQSLIDRL